MGEIGILENGCIPGHKAKVAAVHLPLICFGAFDKSLSPSGSQFPHLSGKGVGLDGHQGP